MAGSASGAHLGATVNATLEATGGSAAAVVGLRRGAIVGGRYRLDEVLRTPVSDLTDTDGGELWRAEDLILSRAVAIRILVDAPADTRHAFLDAATTGCRATDPLVAQTYDAAEFAAEVAPAFTVLSAQASESSQTPGSSGERELGTERPGSRPWAYLVREWVEGQPLRDLLLDGPLAPERATSILQDTALALAHLHEMGVAHGRVHPANIIVREDGQIRLCDAAIGACLESVSHHTAPDTSPEAPLEARFRADVIGLGQTLYAALTGRWPAGSWRGLPPAPQSKIDPHALPARQVRAGVSRDLDAVVSQLLDLDPKLGRPAVRTAAAAATALGALPTEVPTPANESLDARVSAAIRRQQPASRRKQLAFCLGIAALGVITWLLVSSLAMVRSNSATVPTFSTAPTSQGTAPGGLPVTIASVTSFDPPPGDGIENPGQLAAAHDGQPSTAWQTETYATAALGNAKPGVGLLVDLGAARAITQVDLTFLTPGTDVELRAMAGAASTTTAPGTVLADFPLVAAPSLNTGTSLAIRTNAHTTARYWLIWLTKLPSAPGSGFRGSVAEMTFHS